MTGADKAKLDGVAAGATANAGTLTNVTGTAPITATGTGATRAIAINNAGANAAGAVPAPGTAPNVLFGRETATAAPSFLGRAAALRVLNVAEGANAYVHPAHTARNAALTGAAVYSNVIVNNQGHVTDLTTRSLTAANVGALGNSGRQHITGNGSLQVATWAAMASGGNGDAVFGQNFYRVGNTYHFANTHASMGARGIVFRWSNAANAAIPHYFNTGTIATTADAVFTPVFQPLSAVVGTASMDVHDFRTIIGARSVSAFANTRDANINLFGINSAIGHAHSILIGSLSALGPDSGGRIIAGTGTSNILLGNGSRLREGAGNTIIGSDIRRHTATVPSVAQLADGLQGNNNVIIGSGIHAHMTANTTPLAGCTVLGVGAELLANTYLQTSVGHLSRARATGSVILGTRLHCSHNQSGIISPNGTSFTFNSTANDLLIVGRSGIPMAHFGISQISDGRDKRDITALCYNPLEFIEKLRPVQYREDYRDDYIRYEEITEDEYNALDEYTKRHKTVEEEVCCIDGTDIEWLDNWETYHREDETNERLKTRFQNRYAKNREEALDEARSVLDKFALDKLDDEVAEERIGKIIKTAKTARFVMKQVEPDGSKAGKRYHNGFIAQEIEQACKEMGFDFAGINWLAHNKDEDGLAEGDDKYLLRHNEFIAPMVGAIQELSRQNKALEERVAKLENMLDSVLSRI